MRYVIISDIHGCHRELYKILEDLSVTAVDEVISIGDIIHKGPDETDCIRLMQKVSERYVFGNHEEKQLRWERHERKRLQTGKANPMKHVEDYKPLMADHEQWLKEAARLFIQIEAGDKKFLLVHGGIEPKMRSLPSTNIPHHLSKKQKYYAMNVLRTRYVNPKGTMVPLGDEQPEDRYWAEVYDGRFGHVLFGHQPFLNRNTPREYEHATGIDLGCVYGGQLCAAIIDGDTGDLSYHTVDAFEKYRQHRTETGSKKRVPK